MRVNGESEKAGLKLNIQKLRSWNPVPSLHGKERGKKMEMVADFIYLGSKITAESGCSHKIKDPCSLEEKLRQT